ncbi:MAG: hypothetical protein FWD58_01195 [Firmicutes bacterium]|nr:hypothetical protein [Bacillota bacterium]
MNISFPHLGFYHIPIKTLLSTLFPEAAVTPPPPITRRTLELGARHSPDFVCAPFKYNLGNFIEALENGADTLFSAGGGCRFGFYGGLIEQILRDLGYRFTFVSLFNADGLKIGRIRREVKRLGGRAGYPGLAHALLLAFASVALMDEVDIYVRQNAAFEVERGAFDRVRAAFLQDLASVRSFSALRKTDRVYAGRFLSLAVRRPQKALRVGLVGELFDLMEPFANRFIERELINNGISVSRFVNASYLLNQPKSLERKTVKAASPYLTHAIGADGTFSVAKTHRLARGGFDGIIHIKPFGCTPEVNAMPALQNISRDCGIPVAHFSFDAHCADSAVKTRVEAFCDMLKMRKGL